MEIIDGILNFDSFTTVTLGIIVLFLGKQLTNKVAFLSNYSIPESVSGGLFVSLIITVIYLLSGYSVQFDLEARDVLLVYFFTTIGINASFSDLRTGGKPLVILLMITIVFMMLQNLTGITVAKLFDLPSQFGVISGSVSLIGGHGTTIAYAPKIAEDYNIPNALEIGTACATFGLILASLMGGPIAKFLIKRYKLTPNTNSSESLDVGVAKPSAETKNSHIDHFDFLDALLAIHIAGIVGILLNEALVEVGVELPLFVTCLFGGILITNLIPKNFPSITGREWPSRKPAVGLIADVSLGTFLAMSLMSLKLWTMVGLAGPVLAILAAQLVLAILVTLFLVFPLMGRNYDAAVISSGFGGISLGATPTAIANMSAVTAKYGPSHVAFIVVPLVCAFFIDIVNAIIIPYFLNNF